MPARTILHTKTDLIIPQQGIEITSGTTLTTGREPSYVVRRRTARPHGISTPERDRFSEATHYLESLFPKKNVWIVVERHDATERAARELIRDVKEDFGQLQLRAGFPRWHVDALESAYGVHSNLIGPLPLQVAKRLQGYAYGSRLHIRRVYDMPGLVSGYLLKEATPQAAYGKSFRRNKGSHRLGEGGGDRIRLSSRLEAALLEKGVIEPHKRTYAARSLPKPEIATTASAAAPIAVPKTTPDIIPANVPASSPVQLALPLEAPPVKLIELVDAKRRRLGLPQHEIAGRLGVRQPHYANALGQRDHLSAWSLNRALEFLAA